MRIFGFLDQKRSKKKIDLWHDVKKCYTFWETPLEHLPNVQQKLFREQLVKVMWRFQLGDQPILQEMLRCTSMLPFEGNSVEQEHILNTRPCPDNDELMVILDKDPKRMCIASIDGYHYRLFKGNRAGAK